MRLKLNRIAALCLAAVGSSAVLAQSNVTLYGIMDAGMRRSSGLDAAHAASPSSVSALTSGINTTSRWGLRGSEDLGGGLRAEVNLESGINVDTGQPNAKYFDRASVVGLRNSWGSVMVGRQTTVLADALGTIDPLSNRFAAFNPNIQVAALSGHRLGLEYGPSGSTSNAYRLDNSVKASGTWSGVTLRLMHGFGEQATGSSRLSASGVSLGYAAGNYAAVIAQGRFRTAANLELDAVLAGARVRLGAATLMASYGKSEAQTTATATTTNKTISVGGSYRLQPKVNLVLGHYIVDRSRTGSADDGFNRTIGFVEYELSKRSLVYVQADATRWDNNYQGAANKSSANGVSLGVKHTF